MPEAPVIRLLCDKSQQFVGQEVLEASALSDKVDASRLIGLEIKDILVFGKQFIIQFDKLAVRVHLMLFGKFFINEERTGGKVSLALKFKNGQLNFYASNVKFIEEPLDDVYDWSTDVMNKKWDGKAAFEKLAGAPDVLISDALIDQDIFNGLGNKGVNETLYRTKVHPSSRNGAIPLNKRKEIVKEAVGFSFDYYDWEKKGVASENFAVYKKKTCPVHGTVLKHEEVGKSGRTCHFCDKCQKLYS